MKLILRLIASVFFVLLLTSDQFQTLDASTVTLSGLANQQMQGSGTSSDPYQVTNVQQLKTINSKLQSNYILMNDIDLKNEEWEPLGNFFPFKGTFDGGGYRIKNLKIQTFSSISGYGFFGFAQGATIKNLIIENINLESGSKDIGGILAAASDVSIINCAVLGNGKVKATGSNYVGGLVGIASNIKIEKSFSTIDIEGTNRIGGIVGDAGGDSLIANCYSTSTIRPGSYYYGGLTGPLSGKISNSYYAGTIEGNQSELRLVSNSSNPTFENCYFDVSKSTNGKYRPNSFARSTEEMMKRDTFIGWDFEGIWEMKEGVTYPGIKSIDTEDENSPEEKFPEEIKFTQTNNTLTLVWEKINGAIAYEVMYNDQILTATSEKIELEINPNISEHIFKIRAKFATYIGDWSKEFTYKKDVTNIEAVAYKYDKKGRLTEVIYPTGEKLIYTYDPSGNIKSVIKSKTE